MKKRKFKPRFYLFLTLIITVTIALSFTVNTKLQLNNLINVSAATNYLEFEPIDDITKWHNKELKYVYLTFDDGPSRNTEAVLDILNEHNVDATFFVLGTNVTRLSYAQDMLNRMVNEGHYIGMHSMTHQYDTLYKGPNAASNFVNEMNELQAIIKDMTNGFESILTRAPYGTGGGTFKPEHVEQVKNANLKVWDWHVDSMDWAYTPQQIMKNIKDYTEMNSNKNNLIVLFHEKDVTLEVLPQVIQYYKDLGYEFAAYNPNQHVIMNFMNSLDL